MSRRRSKYNCRMLLRGYTATQDEYRQQIKTPVSLGNFWGRIQFAYKGEEMLGGARQSDTPQVASVAQWWISLPYRSDITFSPRYEVIYGNRTFDIISVYEHDKKRELRLLCREVQP